MFGLELKYIIILALIIIAIISGIKKLFKLAITIGIVCIIYYLYTMFLA